MLCAYLVGGKNSVGDASSAESSVFKGLSSLAVANSITIEIDKSKVFAFFIII